MKRALLIFLSALVLAGCATQKKQVQETVFYPPLPEMPRLQFLTAINSEEDLGKKQSAFEEFLLGEIPPLKRIDRPYDMGVVKNRIYVCDRAHMEIIVIDLATGTFELIEDKRGGALIEPAGIWVTDDDYKYVADFGRKQVVVFDSDNKYVTAYGNREVLDKPFDVAVYENKVYVVDFNKHQVIIFDKETREVTGSIGATGEGEWTFYKPTHIFVDNEGNLLVNDAFNFMIKRFTPEGEFINSVGFLGDNIGGFARPKGIMVDKENHLYAVDAAFENVQIFEADTGRALLVFGGYGAGRIPGGMYLPAGIAIDYENVGYFQKYADKDFKLQYIIYVGNSLGASKLNVYGFGEWTGEPLPGMEK